MNVITEPTVYLVGRQETDDQAIQKFLDDHQVGEWRTDAVEGSEALCEVAGRVCYMSFARPRPGGNKEYLGHIKEVGHGSVLEHAVFNLIFTGVSRTLTHELVRHRAGFGYSQLSQRYVDESVAEYVVPHDLKDEVQAAQVELAKWQAMTGNPLTDVTHVLRVGQYLSEEMIVGLEWIEHMLQSTQKYKRFSDYLFQKTGKKIVDTKDSVKTPGGPLCLQVNLTQEEKTAIRKTARQAARSVLPNATETKIFVTGNARAFRHFLEQRGSRHAEPEIRKLATKVLLVLNAAAPVLFGDYSMTPLPDGTFEVDTKYRKV